MKLRHYLYTQLGVTFFPIFLGLYFITSIIFLVRIASWTSIIQINFAELSLLYLYMVPSILFYTLPITFFVALVITLAKLSSEYELIVITSFGLKPIDILKIFFPITLILSFIMLVVSIALIPKSEYLIDDFYYIKKKEANFNIKASEFGQKFGDWLIYISEKQENLFSNVTLFKTQKNIDQFIVSDTAQLDNQKGNLTFKLFEGKSFHLDNDTLNQIDYKVMSINDTAKGKSAEVFVNAKDYWQKRFETNDDKDKFTFNILTSIFPLISLFLVLAYGYFNPRYEKNRAVMYAVIFTVLYYILGDFLSKKVTFNALYIIPFVWTILTYYLYNRRVKKVY